MLNPSYSTCRLIIISLDEPCFSSLAVRGIKGRCGSERCIRFGVFQNMIDSSLCLRHSPTTLTHSIVRHFTKDQSATSTDQAESNATRKTKLFGSSGQI